MRVCGVSVPASLRWLVAIVVLLVVLQYRYKTFRHIVKQLVGDLPKSNYSATCFLSHARPRRIARSVNNYYYYYYYY